MDLPFHPGMTEDAVQAAAAPLLAMLHEAGAAIEAVQAARDDDGLDVQRKGDGSPVTQADHASHAVLDPALQQAFPDLPVVSEESWSPGDAIPDRAWVVDPLDGTKEFIHRNGEYVVNVGLLQDRRPVFGAVHVPATRETFLGGQGIGAWRVRGTAWTPLRVAARAPHTPLRVVASRSHRGPLVDDFLDALEADGFPTECVPMGSAWKLVLVAEGKADCYPRLGPTMWWDTLAPHAVVEGAGGAVLDSEGTPFTYRLDEDGEPRNGFFLVVGPDDRRIVDAFRRASRRTV